MAGDDFAAFVHATGPQLYRAAMLLTGDHHLAEDLTQATYAKLFASWGRVRRADNPVAYARTTLTNTFLSHRRLRRNSEVPTEELADQQTGQRPDKGSQTFTVTGDPALSAQQLRDLVAWPTWGPELPVEYDAAGNALEPFADHSQVNMDGTLACEADDSCDFGPVGSD